MIATERQFEPVFAYFPDNTDILTDALEPSVVIICPDTDSSPYDMEEYIEQAQAWIAKVALARVMDKNVTSTKAVRQIIDEVLDGEVAQIEEGVISLPASFVRPLLRKPLINGARADHAITRERTGIVLKNDEEGMFINQLHGLDLTPGNVSRTASGLSTLRDAKFSKDLRRGVAKKEINFKAEHALPQSDGTLLRLTSLGLRHDDDTYEIVVEPFNIAKGFGVERAHHQLAEAVKR